MATKQKQKSDNFSKVHKRSKRREMLLPVFNKFLLVFILVSSIYFVGSINNLSIKGFVLQELKTNFDALNQKNIDHELNIMKFESYEYLSQRAEDIKMVKVDRVDYITIMDEEVAVK